MLTDDFPQIKSLFKNEIFVAGFMSGIILFIVLNLMSFDSSYEKYRSLQNGRLSGGSHGGGFPFYFSLWTSGIGSQIFWIGLALDILIALLTSLAIGFTAKYLWAKSRRDD